jgi:hypothetical protein
LEDAIETIGSDEYSSKYIVVDMRDVYGKEQHGNEVDQRPTMASEKSIESITSQSVRNSMFDSSTP